MLGGVACALPSKRLVEIPRCYTPRHKEREAIVVIRECRHRRRRPVKQVSAAKGGQRVVPHRLSTLEALLVKLGGCAVVAEGRHIGAEVGPDPPDGDQTKGDEVQHSLARG